MPSTIESEIAQLIVEVEGLYREPELQAAYLLHYQHLAGAHAFENRRCNSRTSSEPAIPEGVERVMGALAALSLRREVRFFVVDPDYYAWSLQQRAFRLTAPSTAHLCKCVIVENTRAVHYNHTPLGDSRYYCVVVQYVSSINTAKLVEYVRALTNHAKGRKQYNFRLVAPSVAFDLTSYGNNAVSPFGMTKAIPIILEAAITQLRPPVLYLGAGHVDWKVSLPVEKFIAATGSPVVDLAG